MSESVFPRASDAPLHPDVALAAANWFVQLTSDVVSDADRSAWERWRAASPEHERAWLRTQALTQQFKRLEPSVGFVVLDRKHARMSRDRRRVVKSLALLLTVGGSGWLAYGELPWQNWTADYRTATGEQRTILLSDGTRLMLNTATAVNVVFGPDQRLIILREGEIHVESGSDPEYANLADNNHRPLRVQTAEGRMTALGTRFIVRNDAGQSHLSVLEGAVEVSPVAGSALSTQVVESGEDVWFDRNTVHSVAQAEIARDAWTNGMLFADRMPLTEFVAEINRYRRGHVACDPELASLRISGSFPLNDTDAILQSIVDVLPVRVTMVTRYWVRVQLQ